MQKQTDPNKYLPLTPALFQVLLALADGEKHGYAILKEVSARTAGRVELSTGTLYGIIKRLRKDGLIEEPRGHLKMSRSEQRRRTYRLSALGREVAVAEARRLERIVDMARQKRLLDIPQPQGT